jgi:hypothetical protein
LTELLLEKGHDVTVVGRTRKNLEGPKRALLSFGFAEGAANSYVEMFATLDTGLLFEDIQKTKPKIAGRSIEDFAKTWAAAYRRNV